MFYFPNSRAEGILISSNEKNNLILKEITWKKTFALLTLYKESFIK